MFNESYIDDFARDGIYKKVLNDPNYLEKIKIEYFKKYRNDADAYFLALKESIDHYIAKKISEDKNYIYTNEFKNYFNYIKEVVNQNIVQCGKKKIPIELSTNVVFEYLDEKTLEKINVKNYIKYNEKVINSIISKVDKKEPVSDEEVKLLSIYFDTKKDFKNPEFERTYTNFIKFILEKRQVLKKTPELISSILTFLPSYYKEGVQDVRSFLVTYDRSKKVDWAHSNGSYKYTAFEMERFKHMKLDSDKSIKSSRTCKEVDLMLLILIQFHELTHQVQKNKVSEDRFNIDAIPYEINQLLRFVYRDYKGHIYGKNDPRNFEGNHDSDEIEIDADQKAWEKLSCFISDFMDRNDQNKKKSLQCSRNAKAVNCRRAFSTKEDPRTRKRYRTMDYDMELVQEAIKKNPEVLNHFHHLKNIFSAQGHIKTDILFQSEITMTPAGRMISNNILINAPIQLFIRKINSNMYSNQQIDNLIHNFVQVPRANTSYIRELKNIDLSTFNETHCKFNVTEKNLDHVYNYYFLECANQLLKFSVILENIKQRMGNKYVNRCYKTFSNYYNEMLQNINCPDLNNIEHTMKKFEKSENPILISIANKTMSYVKSKDTKTINPAYIDSQSRKAIGSNPNGLCDGVTDISDIINWLRNYESEKRRE